MDHAYARRHIQTLGKQARAWRSDQDGSRDAVAHLVAMARAGSSAAEGEIMEIHAPQIRGECWRLRVRRLDVDDYVQEGKVAMRKPIYRFDTGREIPLWFYARPFVRGKIIAALGGSLGLTPYQTQIYKRVWHAHDAVTDSGREATACAVRGHLREHGVRVVSEATVEAILAAGRRWLFSLDEERDARSEMPLN